MKKIKQILFKVFKNIVSLFAKLGINRKTFGAGEVYDFFYKFFWPYKKVIKIQGNEMLIDPGGVSPAMLQTFEVYAKNLIHEEATTQLFKQTVKEGNKVVDLGANIGYFTLLAAKLVGPKGKVFAFEPEPTNYNYLIKNIKLNNYDNVIATQKAVSDKNGQTELYICDYDSGHHTINKYNGIEAYSRGRDTKEHSIEVETVTLDTFLEGKTDSLDVIKMDVEGAEALALAGMNNILRGNKRLKMFIEFFPLLIEKIGSSPEEFIRKLLDDYKFSIFIIPDDYDALKGKMTKISSVDEIMKFRQKEEDHINLFLKREEL